MTINELIRKFPLVGLKDAPWQATEDASYRAQRKVAKAHAVEKGHVTPAAYAQYLAFCDWMDTNGHTVVGVHQQGGVLIVSGSRI